MAAPLIAKKPSTLLIHAHDKTQDGVGRNTEQMPINFSDALKICNISRKWASSSLSCGEINKGNETQRMHYYLVAGLSNAAS